MSTNSAHGNTTTPVSPTFQATSIETKNAFKDFDRNPGRSKGEASAQLRTETNLPGLRVHCRPLGKWPDISEADGVANIEVTAYERVFPDGTCDRIIDIVAGPTELTYESTHLLIDFLQEAARSLVATDSGGSQ